MPAAMSRKSTAVSTTSTVAPVPAGMNAESDESLLKSMRDMAEGVKKGLSSKLDMSSLPAVLDMLRNADSLDDRKLLMEYMLSLISRIPEGPLAGRLNGKFIKMLYNDLDHPPPSLVGKEYAWRTTDGSKNNIMMPEMGKAGTPYARSVQQAHPLPANELPDAGLLFDTLLRRDKFVEHPAGCSSFMFSFAALVIHSVFRTSHRDTSINETSSYIDLSPVYGHTQEIVDKVRIRDGRGCIHPDTFAEDRLLLLPPAVCVIIILFSRNHNYIAKKLLEINERGTFVDPTTLSGSDAATKRKLMDQDEELFQVARLINCNWFATMVFSDYLSAILGMVRQGSSWILNPFEEMRNDDGSFFERGKGNICSVEFNSLYRWHATTSAADEEWNNRLHKRIFPGISYDDVTLKDFAGAKSKLHVYENDLTEWSLGVGDEETLLKRQEDGTFRDEDLARILKNATEEPAGAFKAHGTPGSMRLHEIMGIEQNRRQGVCNLNDFRKYIGLKPFESFKEWNSDPKVYEVAEKMYGHINNLELYVGLQAEEAKPVMPGAGLCPGYTISRAILSDAVALTRGDRFFTTDRTPYNLTAWGYTDSDRTPNGAGFGGAMGRLLLRHLPGQFTHDSVYTWFPMLTPKAMKKFLGEMNNKDYSFDRPADVPRAPATVTVKDYSQIQEVLKSEDVVSPYAVRAARVIKGKGFYIVDDSEAGKTRQNEVSAALTGAAEGPDRIGTYFFETTRDLLKSNSVGLICTQDYVVDVVRDVLKVAPVMWACEEVAGITLETAHVSGFCTAKQMYQKLANIYSFIFLEIQPANMIMAEHQARADAEELLEEIKSNMTFLSERRKSIMGSLTRMFSGNGKSTNAASAKSEISRRLHLLVKNTDQLAHTILAVLVGSTVELSVALTHAVNAALDSEQVIGFKATDANLKANLERFSKEIMVTDPPFQGVYRARKAEGNSIAQPEERLFLDLHAANSRVPSNGKHLHASTLYACLGETVTHNVIGNVLRAIYSLDDVCRATGRSGKLASAFRVDNEPMLRKIYLQDGKTAVPWPLSMTIQYTKAAQPAQA